MKSGIVKILGYVCTALLSAMITFVVTYYSTRNAQVSATDAEFATRYIDYQTFPEASWSPKSPVPGVQFSYTDKAGKRIDNISGARVNLYNFSDRDTTDLHVQIDAVGTSGKPPVLLGFRVANGAVEDFGSEETVVQRVNGDTLSLEFKISRFNRKNSLEPGRAISLYFSSVSVPNLNVTVSGGGFEGRSFEYIHYSDLEQAKRSWFDKYGAYLIFFSIVFVSIGVFLVGCVRTYKRQNARMRGLTDVVDGALSAVVQQHGMSSDQQRVLASEVAFRCWQSIYNSMWKVDQWLFPRPTRVK